MAHTTILVRYLAKPGMGDRALSAIRHLVTAVLTREPACVDIEILQDVDRPEAITLIERWPDREAFMGPHMQQPHLQQFIEGAGAFLAGPPDISFHSGRDAVT